MSRGYIPERVHFFHRTEEPCDRAGEKLTCQPAFPVGSRSIRLGHKVVANAKRWVTNAYWRHGRQTMKQEDVPEVILDNVPRQGYRVVGAEQRGEGGRAWKVITPEGFLVDMREDVFLPILLRKGLPRNGMIEAEFQWCQNGSQLRLEEVGSKAHGQYTPEKEAENRPRKKIPKKKAIGLKELEVGGVYEFEWFGMTSRRVYLGRVRHDGKLKTAWWNLRGHTGVSWQRALNAQWEMSLRGEDTVQVFVMSGSRALKRLHGDVTLPEGWRGRAHATTGDGYTFIHPRDLEWQ